MTQVPYLGPTFLERPETSVIFSFCWLCVDLTLKGKGAIIVLKMFGATAENFSPVLPGARDLRTAVSNHLNLSGYYTDQLVSRSKIPHFAHILYLMALVSLVYFPHNFTDWTV